MSKPQGDPGPRCAGEYLTTYSCDYRSPNEQTQRPAQPCRLRARTSSPPIIPALPRLAPMLSPFSQQACMKKPAKARPPVLKVDPPQTLQGVEPGSRAMQTIPARMDKTTQVRLARFDKATQLYPGEVENSP
ncbi:hypothetical protein SKAU_G00319870 [Synaphobranchus kaupii]|uniref:Uncharacterized protein n=1 Tax=Synaphobranchus kaupii TaxID=118154 RepID=A0A9Q1IJS2_SYNKA|nr:hypothetical protein SKAU_G00319870 [Synaphobranchus kaupii]